MKSTIYVIEHARKDNWSKVKNYGECRTFLRAGMTRSGSLNTGLTKEDEARLEAELGYDTGTLAKSSPFWHTFAVVLEDVGTTLDISNPNDELQYLLAKAHKRVADGHSRLNPSMDYVMYNKEQEAISINEANKARINAIIEYSKMSMDEKRKALRVLGLGSTNNSESMIESTLFTYIENNSKEFMTRWVSNNDKDVEFLIEEAVAHHILRKNKTSYYYGTDMLGTFLNDTIAFLKDKNNSDVRKAITAALESKKAA